MSRHILILVVFFSFLGVLPAQEKNILVQVIIDDKQEEHPGSVYVTNLRTKKTFFFNSDGIVILKVMMNDVLYFNSEFYHPRQFNISQTVYDTGQLKIHLNPVIVELAEANLGFKLTGDLKKDAKNAAKKDSVSIIYENLGIKAIDVPPPNPNGQSAGQGILAERLIGAISGYNKRQNKKFEYSKKQNEENEIRNYFGDDFFLNELKIPFHKIEEFIFYMNDTTPIYQQIKSNQFLEAEELIRNKSEIYKQRLNTNE